MPSQETQRAVEAIEAAQKARDIAPAESSMPTLGADSDANSVYSPPFPFPSGRTSPETGFLSSSRGSRSVDIRMYQQLQKTTERMSDRIQDNKRYIAFLENSIRDRDDRLFEQGSLMNDAATELGAMLRLIGRAADGIMFGVPDPESGILPGAEALKDLVERMAVTEAAVAKMAGQADQSRPREIPIRWMGVAHDVRLMGSFDHWTRGIDLSAEDMGDQVFVQFNGVLRLAPGTYHTKFLIDDEWRLAGDWPTVVDEDGNESNVLVVK